MIGNAETIIKWLFTQDRDTVFEVKETKYLFDPQAWKAPLRPASFILRTEGGKLQRQITIEANYKD
jgi:hypothetical protein